jgi:L-ascorbate metabolism protein UlaG (beta-lactamase superfamily)
VGSIAGKNSWTMTREDAMKAARLVSAKHSIPYHMSIKKLFDREIAGQFQVEGSMILADGEELLLK